MEQRRIRRRATILTAGAMLYGMFGAAAAGAADDPEWIPREIVVLQGLDKVTARISTVTAPIGETVAFGTLQITAETCQEHPPTLAPESAAFLQIDDQPPDEAKQRIFSGWMFASSPALNALEHPVYDVWVLSCRSASTEGQSSAAGTN